MNAPGPDKNRYGSVRLRLLLYAFILAFCLIPIVIEEKTGIPLARDRRYGNYHDPLSWDEVWARLLELDRLPLYFAIFVVGCAVVEWRLRFGKTEEEEEQEQKEAESAFPPKRFTRLWLLATGGYMVVLIALYMYSGSIWAWSVPLPVPNPAVAFAPILVSLGALAMYTGEVQMEGGTFYRSRNPFMFWLCVAVAFSLGAFMFLAGLGVIGR
jgi:hypothetical protein